MKVFWSWQSDTPGKTGRFFVRDVLQAAIDELRQPRDVEEPSDAERRETLHLDHDRKDVPGSPDLVRTIFNKIDASTVVVADVTPVGTTSAGKDDNGNTVQGKKLINSNAAIELGYALKSLGDTKVLQVFNSHYGTHEELPFDLRHKGGALVFDLPPNSDNTRIAAERKKLKNQFIAALKLYLTAPAPVAFKFAENKPTFNKAAYFNRGEILAQIGVAGEVQESYTYATETLCYLRFMPQARQSPLPRASLNSWVPAVPLLTRSAFGGISISNDYGAMIFQPGRKPPGANAQLAASTQLFLNGEIWAISADVVKRESEFSGGPLIHTLTLESLYYDRLRKITEFASREMSAAAPFQIECGLVHGKGIYIKMPDASGGWVPWGPMRDEEIVHHATINSADEGALNQFLLTFFNKVYDSTGNSRPENLFNFPPGPPR